MHRSLCDHLKSSVDGSAQDRSTQLNEAHVELIADGTISPLKLEEFLPHRLSVLASVVSDALSKLCARHGLLVGEWMVLMTIGEFGQITAKKIGDRNRMHKTTVSRVVAELSERGLIMRQASPVDRRNHVLQLTALGKTVYEVSAPMAGRLGAELESAMDPAEREALDRCLTKLVADLGLKHPHSD
jgi:DNA-binding MarR family transcriptional regulator